MAFFPRSLLFFFATSSERALLLHPYPGRQAVWPDFQSNANFFQTFQRPRFVAVVLTGHHFFKHRAVPRSGTHKGPGDRHIIRCVDAVLPLRGNRDHYFRGFHVFLASLFCFLPWTKKKKRPSPPLFPRGRLNSGKGAPPLILGGLVCSTIFRGFTIPASS